MAIYKGNKKVVAVYKGSTPINKIYKGVTLVFQKSGGGGSTHLIEGTATGTFNLKINDQKIPITPDADGKWFYDTDEQITSLNSAIYNTTAVTSVDLSNLDLTGITTIGMFNRAYNITSIKFNNAKSMKLKDVNSMFSGCESLTSLDLSSFDTSNLTSVGSLFSNCRSLVSLDLSNWNTSNLTSVGSLFFNCSSLVSLDLSNFDMSKVHNYSYMFNNCSSLSTIKCKQAFKDWCITNQDTIKLPTAMREGGSGTWEIIHLFEGTATGDFELTVNGNSIPITPDADGKWFYDTDEQITNLDSAFSYQMVVTSVDLSNLDLTSISTSSMFEETNVTSIKFNNTKSMKLVDVRNMFFNCMSLTSLDLSSFDTSNVTQADSLFSGCISLETLDLSNFDMSKATNYADMFRDCDNLTHIKCKQAFKDWCITNQGMISLPIAMIEGGSGTWEIVA